MGVKETSYYPSLSNLLKVIGKKLKPRVRCIIHPRSIGVGLPDGALITADQNCKADDPLADGLIPSRGTIEIKAPDEDVQAVVGSEQVAKYLSKYETARVRHRAKGPRPAHADGRLHACALRKGVLEGSW